MGDAVDDGGEDTGASALADRLDRLADLERELSLAQRWVQARRTATVERIADAVAGDGERWLYAETVRAVVDGADTAEAVAEAVGVTPRRAREALSELAEAGFLARESDGDGERWTVE